MKAGIRIKQGNIGDTGCWSHTCAASSRNMIPYDQHLFEHLVFDFLVFEQANRQNKDLQQVNHYTHAVIEVEITRFNVIACLVDHGREHTE